MFCHNLSRVFVGWCKNLSLGSFHTFEELEKVFKVAFSHRLREKGTGNTLLNVFQGEKERLEEYMVRFTVEV